MADTEQQPTASDEVATQVSMKARLTAAPAALLTWATSGRISMAITAGVALTLIAVVFAAWSYLAHLAVDPIHQITVNDALAAIDAGDFEKAKSLVSEMQDEPAAPELLSGALFVLGVIKANEADAEYSEPRRRAMHLVAGRYFQKAQALGFPADRELEGAYLLGRSLVLGNQLQAGVAALEGVLGKSDAPQIDIHTLLVGAQLRSPTPHLASALHHNQSVLAAEIPAPQRERALLQQVEILVRLGRVADARAAANQLPPELAQQANVQLLRARISYHEAVAEPDAALRQEKLDAVIAEIRESQRLSPRGSELSHHAMYWIGRAYQAQGKNREAIDQFQRLTQLHGDSSEGIAATLARADQELAEGRFDRAMLLYRQVLDSVSDPLTYVNPLLSLDDFRKSLLGAHQRFLDGGHFEEALTLVDHFEPTFTHAEQVEFRAEANRKWGSSLISQAADKDRWHAEEMSKEGRFRLRTAGRAYEELARLRFATRSFTKDLWEAGEAYFAGQSYTNAARIFQEYLHHEARWQNSKALLRLGQSHLAARNLAKATDALEECIEMYPRDGVVYMARLEAARAYRQRGNSAETERLLKTNLTGDELKPVSPEWRDSLFELGQLLYDLGRYDESIAKLDEAVRREAEKSQPDAEKSLLAQYTVARAYHSASEAPSERLRESKTETERQKNRQLVNQSLEKALEAYSDVQRMVTLSGSGDADPLGRTILRNCYMMQGSVLYALNRFEEARQAYSNVSGLYQNEPLVLESFVKIANCWRRLDEPIKARGTIEQAKLALQRLPPETDFRLATNFSRQQWTTLLDQMSQW